MAHQACVACELWQSWPTTPQLAYPYTPCHTAPRVGQQTIHYCCTFSYERQACLCYRPCICCRPSTILYPTAASWRQLSICMLSSSFACTAAHLAFTVNEYCFPVVVWPLPVPLLFVLPLFASLEHHCTALAHYISNLQHKRPAQKSEGVRTGLYVSTLTCVLATNLVFVE